MGFRGEVFKRFLGSLCAGIIWSIELRGFQEGCGWEVVIKLMVFPSADRQNYLLNFNDGNCEVNYKSLATLGW